jgi:hypothetical protein
VKPSQVREELERECQGAVYRWLQTMRGAQVRGMVIPGVGNLPSQVQADCDGAICTFEVSVKEKK